MMSFVQEIRFAVRMLVKTPVVTLVAAVSLAFGIAAVTATVSVANGFFFRPLRWHDTDRIVLINEINRKETSNDFLEPVAAANFLDWRQATSSYETLEAYTSRPVNLSGEGEPERLTMIETTAGVFTLLGSHPFLGRGFRDDEGRGGDARVVVLSHDFWNRRFAADEGILGTTVRLDGEPHTVIGVLPQDFDFIPGNADLFWPTDLEDRRDVRDERAFFVLGRLRDGVEVADALAELSGVAERLERLYPESNRGFSVRVQKVRNVFPGPTDTRLMYVLLAVSGFVLVLACVNVANLLLARADTRQKEIAVRSALGAGRGRIVRQLLSESVILALLGGALGTALSAWAVRGLAASMPAELPRAFFPSLDGNVLALTLGVSILAGILFGITPALHSVGDPGSVLADSSRGGTASRKRSRLRSAFIVAETAVALSLVTGAGLLTDAFQSLVSSNPGFEPDGLLAMQLTASEDVYENDARVAGFYREVLRRVEELPAVTEVAAMSHLPRTRGHATESFTIDGQPIPEAKEEPIAFLQVVSDGFFSTLQNPLLRGRALSRADRAGAPEVVVVNDSLARRFFPDREPIGERLTLLGVSREIVGVSSDALLTRIVLEEGIPPTMYVPMEQHPQRSMAFTIRTAGEPSALVPVVREAVWAIDPAQPIAGLRPLWDHIEVSLSGPKVIAQTLTAFGLVALLLAGIGMYGVIAHNVSQRRREIGIRMALGANRVHVVRWVTRQGLWLAGIGFAIGLPIAGAILMIIRSVLFGLVPINVAYLAGVIGMLALVSIIASFVPAHRASRIDPSRVLQAE